MQRPAITVYVGVGANLGDAAHAVRQAIDALAHLPNTHLQCASSIYRTAPLESSGPDYMNAVVAIQTGLTAPDLMLHLQSLERRAGRERPYRNAPRTLDLDLLLYGNGVIQSAGLSVPHPRMWERGFVVLPLAEIAPQWVSLAALQRVCHQRVVKL